MLLKQGRPYWILIKDNKIEILLLAAIALFTGYFDNNLYLLEEFNLSIPAFLSVIIIVSLTFKTNKAYQRWWEAKMIWEEVVNSTRAWYRLSSTYVKSDDNELVERLNYRQLAWIYVLKTRLRKENIDSEVKKFLSEQDITFLRTLDNMNQGLLYLQSKDLMTEFNKGNISIFLHVEMEEIIRDLEVCMGKAERIKNTHFPILYDKIIKYSIFLFCFISTYFISDGTVFFEASVSFTISVLFLFLASISQDIQDPFEGRPNDTPMSKICYDLSKEVQREMMKKAEIPELEKYNHYIM